VERPHEIDLTQYASERGTSRTAPEEHDQTLDSDNDGADTTEQEGKVHEDR
jgi:hypothetical protein